MLKVIEKIRAGMDKVIPYFTGVLFLICVAATGYGTINRTLGLSLSASWVEELSIYSMIWCTVLLLGHLLRKGMHTQFTLLAERLNGKVLSVWKLIVMLIELAVFVILFIGGIQLAANGGKMIMSALPLTMTWAYLSIPIGAAIAILELIMSFIEEATGAFGSKGGEGK